MIRIPNLLDLAFQVVHSQDLDRHRERAALDLNLIRAAESSFPLLSSTRLQCICLITGFKIFTTGRWDLGFGVVVSSTQLNLHETGQCLWTPKISSAILAPIWKQPILFYILKPTIVVSIRKGCFCELKLRASGLTFDFNITCSIYMVWGLQVQSWIQGNWKMCLSDFNI